MYFQFFSFEMYGYSSGQALGVPIHFEAKKLPSEYPYISKLKNWKYIPEDQI